MGFLRKSRDSEILEVYDFLPLRDPRIVAVSDEDLVPFSSLHSNAGSEFLQKYLIAIRTKVTPTLVELWIRNCEQFFDDYFVSLGGRMDPDEYLGHMTQGFAMAFCEAKVFNIQRNSEMSEAAWGAMQLYSLQNTSMQNLEKQKICMNALLSGYHVAREVSNGNTTLE